MSLNVTGNKQLYLLFIVFNLQCKHSRAKYCHEIQYTHIEGI